MSTPTPPPPPASVARSETEAAAWSAGWRIGWEAAWDAGQSNQPIPPVRPAPAFANGYDAGVAALKETFPALALYIRPRLK